jgi:hypothetical protein
MNGFRSGAAARNASFIAITALRLATLVLRNITPPISPLAISARISATDLSSTLSPTKPTTIICPAICSSDLGQDGLGSNHEQRSSAATRRNGHGQSFVANLHATLADDCGESQAEAL